MILTHDDGEALRELVASAGWALVRDHATREWGEGGACLVKGVRDAAQAGDLAALRTVLGTQAAVQALLGWPAERLQALDRPALVPGPARRGIL